LLVKDLVALEDNSSFEFAGRVARGQLGSFFNTNLEYATDVSLRISITSASGDNAPFDNGGFIPAAGSAKARPLFEQSGLGSGGFGGFLFRDRASDHG